MRNDGIMSPENSINIDGSYGEGGGQIVRTSLSLAMITRQSLKLVNIRGGRKKSGLRPQHLTAVQACASVCGAKVVGAKLGARNLSFTPGPIAPSSYEFHIGTAGAATLVLQTILPPLSLARGISNLVVSGGTHVPWSPTYHYFEQVFIATINRLGFRCEPQLNRWGWYPKGGGEIQTRVESHKPSESFNLQQPFELRRVTGISASSRLPEHIRVRQKKQLQLRLKKAGIEANIELLDVRARNPGTLVFLCAQGKDSVAGFSSLGARGKRAEQVADEAADALFYFLESKAALDSNLADQILIYLANIPGEHQFTTTRITQHLLTNAWVIEKFLPVQLEIVGDLGETGTVIKRDV